MKFLLIEDEQWFVDSLQALVEADEADVEIVVPNQTNLKNGFPEGEAIEEQLLDRVRAVRDQHNLNLILLDTDLSKFGNGIGQAAYRQAFQELGMPVCRYTKRHSVTTIFALKSLKRLASDGASAVWVPGEKVKGDLRDAGILPWLNAVHEGFDQLRLTLLADPDLLKRSLGPAGILARALGRPSAKSDFLGYTAQNFFFFAPPLGNEPEHGGLDPGQQSTRLGYWLLNYILAFPGPILSANAAAAFLNLTVASFNDPDVQALIAPAQYTGPFNKLDNYYWREELLVILDCNDGDIAKAPSILNKLQRVDTENPGDSAYLCILTQEPIASQEAAPRPDWIPSGAQIARIKQHLYDELGPMLNI